MSTHPFIEYPRHLHRAHGVFCVVQNDAEKAAALADGWCLFPFLGDAPPVPPSEAGQGEATAPPAVRPTRTRTANR